MTQTNASNSRNGKSESAASTKDGAITEEKSCTSEPEIENKLEVKPHHIEHACKSGSFCSDNSTSMMRLFNTPSEHFSLVHRNINFHYY